MWLPLLVKRLNQVDMQKKGLQLTAEEIYDINNASLKDAIVQFGGFCTGEFISKEGLLLTNHHCGYDAIAARSTPQADYLTNGFWAASRDKELSNPGLFVDILVRMEDVTGKVLEGINAQTPEAERAKLVSERMKALAAEAKGPENYVTYVRDFFAGNEFYLFVYERYNDVRLVGTPPNAIGKFGGDTDNWMWPRQTGDFSMFRVYADANNKPAAYSPNNKPYQPKKHLPINIGGVEEGDFSMVFGFPGRTQRFMTSEGLKLAVETSNPARVKLRGKRLEILKADMDKSDAVRLKYASEYASVSNYWKYFQGQNAGVKRMKTVEGKVENEAKYNQWASADANRKAMYGNVLADINKGYADQKEYTLSQVYLGEAALAPAAAKFALNFVPLQKALKENKADDIKKATDAIKEASKEYFEGFNVPTDEKLFAAMYQMYYNDVPKSQHPDIFKTVETKYKGNWNKFAAEAYKKTFLTSPEKLNAFLAKPSLKTLENDLIFKTVNSVYNNYLTNINPKLQAARSSMDKATRLYIAGLREMQSDKVFYPDANSTLRLSYGSVKDYEPRDGVHYSYYTTAQGILEKEDPKDEEFIVPQKLIDLIKAKDFGRYADKNGELPVNFITDNDITGGNSGSPVINGRGELIGLAFDGNWEAMSGDLVYDKDYKRCINVDARYVLFVIDKFAGAGHLVNEMTLVTTPSPNASTASTSAEAAKADVLENVKPAVDSKTKVKIKKEERKAKAKMKK
ncbi:S46 family peptidase [Adhaeribacter soli]|uniref:Dipeptidyl-peptidase n=2 Tax=Adhaeribacter soli TaxID=2607655 RepID=A0A5N1J0H3_9BACT|nr:S46 family peptidase [Adhaeribacter soli]